MSSIQTTPSGDNFKAFFSFAKKETVKHLRLRG